VIDIQLLLLMLERVALLLMLTFLLSRMPLFRRIIHHEHGRREKIGLITVFGAFGVISNYMGIEVRSEAIFADFWITGVDHDGALANTRLLGIVIGGMLGGPLVGTVSGIISGLHRYTLGGFTALSCGVSAAVSGVVAGVVGERVKSGSRNMLAWTVAVGIAMECLQQGIILLAAKPFEAALALVRVIALPMIAMNGFGAFLCMMILESIRREEENTKASQTHDALYIAQQTLPYFRQGLNPQSCKKAAMIILRHTDADAIAITDTKQVLAHVGVGADHHIPLNHMSTQLTRQVIEQGRMVVAKSPDVIQCVHPDCPLQAAIVLPLKIHEETVGTLKLYFTKAARANRVDQELAEGLGNLFSMQLEMGQAELQRKLLKDAEIKALQAQVHPHFLFNAINTIASLCRKDPEQARNLLVQLGVFFRSNLQGARQMLIPLRKELEHVEAYLMLEKTRFPDKFAVQFEISPDALDVPIPPFTLQPLVENAILHAFHNRKGVINVSARLKDGKMILVTEDNGQGVPPAKLALLGKSAVDSLTGTGTALHNISRRLKELYGDEGRFDVHSEPGFGTKITICVPTHRYTWGEHNVKGIHR